MAATGAPTTICKVRTCPSETPHTLGATGRDVAGGGKRLAAVFMRLEQRSCKNKRPRRLKRGSRRLSPNFQGDQWTASVLHHLGRYMNVWPHRVPYITRVVVVKWKPRSPFLGYHRPVKWSKPSPQPPAPRNRTPLRRIKSYLFLAPRSSDASGADMERTPITLELSTPWGRVDVGMKHQPQRVP